ncbi:MAG: DEAD/DEAH box helicase [Crenarchaeota archaeon]|nr:DEAD/DEAH box helicase [Thermoproteota archaeon]
MRVDELPIDDKLKKLIIEEKGIVELYPPQAEAIKAGLLDGENIVLATSTATGKTFLAELAMVNSVLRGRGKSILLVPLKALAHEKAEDLKIYEKLGIKIAVTTGDYGSLDTWLEKYDIIVATYEKFDSLLRHRAPWLRSIGLLVIDEVHYISDEKRGPIIESIIAKLRILGIRPQILALSATIDNADEIAEWLEARLVRSSWRPVKLREGVYFDGKIYFNDGEITSVKKLKDPVTDLVIDCLEDEGQVLIFTNSRANTVKLANSLAQFIAGYSKKIIDTVETGKVVSKIDEVSSSKLIAEELKRVVKYGVAFHHAGLDHEVRKVIERAYRDRIIKVVVATTTLAAGVNLPARRVIIHEYRRYEPGIGFEPIPVAEYKQMAGRAGRPRLDPYGEAILIAKREEEIEQLMDHYVRSSPEPVISKFYKDKPLSTHILAAVAGRYVETIKDIVTFLSLTLAARQRGILNNIVFRNLLEARVINIVKMLQESELAEIRNGKIRPTKLGITAALNYLDPDTAKMFVRGLKDSRAITDISYLYIVIKSPEVPKLRIKKSEVEKYFSILRDWSEMLPLLDNVDLEEPEIEELRSVLEEVKTLCLILDWISEAPEDTIVMKYEVGPGDIRMYIDTLEWLINAAAQIARTLGLDEKAERLDILKIRVRYGVKSELVELVQLEGVGRARARALYDAGYRTIEDIANADPREISRRVKGIGEKLARIIVESARDLLKRGYVKASKIEDRSTQGKVEEKLRQSISERPRQRSILDYFT